MIEKKSFFTENNQLNKGYKTEKKAHVNKPLKVDLPEASIIAGYEAIQPGTITRMMEMTAKEQEHRHAIEVIHLKMQKTALRMGRLFAIFTVIAICYTSLTLAANQMPQEAIIFGAIGFFAITISAIFGRVKNPVEKTYVKKPFVPHHKRSQYQSRGASVDQVSSSSEEDSSNATTSNYKPNYRRRKRA